MKEKIKKLLSVFWVFFKIGAFTFGGGYAMIPLIQRETAQNRNWVSDEDILEIIAIAESTPGPIAINSATFIGYKVAGVLGSIFATVGVVLPSFVIIYVISGILRQFQEIKAVQYAFAGIRAGVLALIFKAMWSMYKQCKKSAFAYLIMAFAFVSVTLFDLSLLLVIIICAVAGVVFSLLTSRRADK